MQFEGVFSSGFESAGENGARGLWSKLFALKGTPEYPFVASISFMFGRTASRIKCDKQYLEKRRSMLRFADCHLGK